jgi:putative toxin-antitoxin system antitoxin component (TIGR02293 family)
MLTNYDAKAVAEIMGIAFLRSPEEGSSPAAMRRKEAKGDSRTLTSALGSDFVIRVDDVPLLMVEVRTNKTLAEFDHTAGRANRNYDLKDEWLSSPSPVLIEKAVAKGLPRQALRHVAEWIGGGDKAKVSGLEWGVVPKTTLERRDKQLSPQESERTERVARLFVHARRALGTEEEAREFMTTAHPELDGRCPIDAAKTDLGTRRAEQILNALEYGLAL